MSSQGPTSVPNSTLIKSTSYMPSTLPSSFPLNISSEKPISDPPSAPSEYQIDESSRPSLPSDKDFTDTLSSPSMLLISTTATPI